MALGADAYFGKPLDPERFLSRVLELAPSTATGRLLVVDDDQAVHDLVEEVLGGVGYTVEHATSGEEGLAQARARPPDLVILDLLMDGTNGFQVADELRRDRRTRGVPVVVLTSLEPTVQDRARLRGAVDAVVRKGDGGMVGLVSVVRETLARERRRASDSGAVVRFPAGG
jgi:CheY-like chemotaxis protein